MAFTKEAKIKHITFYGDSFKDYINNIIAYVPNPTDKVICELLLEQHKDNIKIVYESSKSNDRDTKKGMEKIEKIYSKLKNSVILNDEYENVNVSSIETSSVNECVKSLRMLDKKLKTKDRLIFYYAGQVLDELKKQCKSQAEFREELKKADLPICNSVSYAYKLIKFCKTCKEYYNLRYATLSIKIIVENLKDLKKLMEDDNSFWTNNSTSSRPNNETSEFETDDQYIENSYTGGLTSESKLTPPQEIIVDNFISFWTNNSRSNNETLELETDNQSIGEPSLESNRTGLTPGVETMQINEKELQKIKTNVLNTY